MCFSPMDSLDVIPIKTNVSLVMLIANVDDIVVSRIEVGGIAKVKNKLKEPIQAKDFNIPSHNQKYKGRKQKIKRKKFQHYMPHYSPKQELSFKHQNSTLIYQSKNNVYPNII